VHHPRAASRAITTPRLAAGACALTAALLLGATALHPAPAAALPILRAQDCGIAGFDCDMAARIAAVNSFLAGRPGVTGYVLRDRTTGGIYRNANAGTMFWTASTIKLGMAEDLLNRARVGAITISPQDRSEMESMLAVSDDNAADYLWDKYAGPDRMAFDNALRANGMTGLTPEFTPQNSKPYWGFQQCTPNDLDRLMDNILTHMNPDDQAYLLDRMRSVDTNQHWGVWAAGPSMRPGLKNGWSQESSGWVVNSVGFAGPGQRYTLAVMNNLGSQGGFADGQTTTTHVAQLLLAGRA
jgi:hypothetical protein